jgi:hypothetical protein
MIALLRGGSIVIWMVAVGFGLDGLTQTQCGLLPAL